jgi:hypothetical protein
LALVLPCRAVKGSDVAALKCLPHILPIRAVDCCGLRLGVGCGCEIAKSKAN